MQEAIKKSEVLIEALPYIKEFQEKVVVIKYGGSAIVNRRKRKMVLQDITFMSYAGIYPVIVHGGGPFINKKLKKKGVVSAFVKGLRVTDEKAIQIIREVINRVNSQIVKEIKKVGGRAQGIKAGNKVIRVRKNSRFGDIGYVGEIVSVDTDKIENIFKKGVIPVISPLGIGRDGKIYNVNADQAAAAVAKWLKAEKIALLTNVDGILRDKDDKDTLISSLTAKQAMGLVARKRIDAGMIPKVKGCVEALKKGVHKIHIINGGLSHALLLEIFTNEGIGTQITRTKE